MSAVDSQLGKCSPDSKEGKYVIFRKEGEHWSVPKAVPS